MFSRLFTYLGRSRPSSGPRADGFLAACLEPALCVDARNTPVWLNLAARRACGDDLTPDTVVAFRELADRVRQSGVPGTARIVLAPDRGERLFDFTAVADSDGTVTMLGRDVTLDRNLSAALVESRERYKDLIELTSDFAWETDNTGRFVFVSPRGALGYSARDLVGRPAHDFVDELIDGADPFRADETLEDVELTMFAADGTTRIFLAHAIGLLDGKRRRVGARGICRDVTAERARARDLARVRNHDRILDRIFRKIHDEIEAGDMLSTAVRVIRHGLGAEASALLRPEGGSGGLVLAAADGPVPTAAELAGLIPALDDMGAQSDRPIGERRLLAHPVTRRGVRQAALMVWLGADAEEGAETLFERIASQMGVVLAQVENKEMLADLSRTDSLTGLANRRVFYEEAETRLARVRRAGRPAALCFIDLNHFKEVNDRLGHQAGDEALREVAALLTQETRINDLVARLGGDEFALWLDDTDRPGALAKVAQLAGAGEVLGKYTTDPRRPVALSIGLAMVEPHSTESVADIAARADSEMYAVKRESKARMGSGHTGAARAGHSQIPEAAP